MKNLFFKSIFQKFWIAVFLCVIALPLSANASETFSDSELDTLVSTIALYPDPLLVQVLTASTFGDEIPSANAWAQSHKDLTGESLALEMEKANLTYDPSVQALIPFPTVLNTLATYRTWADQLGDAVSTQRDQVMDAIQRMRSAAYDHGQLKSNEQVQVEKSTSIVIQPTNAEYIYVPVYNPSVVYYVYADGYPSIRYHYGVWIGTWYGEWGWGSCWFEWDTHLIYVRNYRWYHHRPIPHHPRRYKPAPRPARMEPAGGLQKRASQPAQKQNFQSSPPATKSSQVQSVPKSNNGTRVYQVPKKEEGKNNSFSESRRKDQPVIYSNSSRDEFITNSRSSEPVSSPTQKSRSGNAGFSKSKRR